MENSNPGVFSRRQWVKSMALPALAATVGPALLAQSAKADDTADSNLAGTRTFNIRDFGAKGDGTTLDTSAVQAAIDAAYNDKGGTVLVPAGIFLIGTVELKSYVTLHIAAGGKLLGSGDGKQYHGVDEIPLDGDSTLGDGHWALIYATYAENVTIEGPGTVDGQGHYFHPPVRGGPNPAGLTGARRPYLFLFYRCKNLAIHNISLLESGYHCIRVIQSTYCRMDAIYIHNRVAGNNDGFHFISCQYVNISNCNVQSQDDACALFGSCQFISVTNSSFSTRWSVFRFGGGIVQNVTVSNCLLYTVYGCPVKMQCGRGARFENMSFSNLVLQDVTGPINIGAGSRAGGRRRRPGTTQPDLTTQPDTQPDDSQGPPVGRFGNRPPAVVRNVSFSNIHGTVTTNPGPLPDFPYKSGYNPGEMYSCITLNAVGDAIIENISFNDVHLTFGGGGSAEQGARRNLPQTAGEYFDLGPMPAYGFYARGAKAITLQNVRFQVASPELRPALIFDHVQDAVIDGLSAQGNSKAESLMRITDSKQVLITSPRVLSEVPVFMRVEGADNERITIDGGDISNATTPLAFADGADEKSVKLRT